MKKFDFKHDGKVKELILGKPLKIYSYIKILQV
jgi:hypothetical protein